MDNAHNIYLINHNISSSLVSFAEENTYYVDFKNRRPDYLKSFIDNLVNWEKVNEEFTKNN